MRFGIILDGGNLPGESRVQALEDRLGKARRTRDFGYHSLWMGGGFLNNGWHASSLLARAAAEAQGLELGLLALLPLDHPVTLAEQVSTLDAIAGGRLVLAASLGWRPHELQAFNVDRTERLPRFRESLEVMKLLWTQDRVTYQGNHYRLEDVPGTAKPIQDSPPPHLHRCQHGPWSDTRRPRVRRLARKLPRHHHHHPPSDAPLPRSRRAGQPRTQGRGMARNVRGSHPRAGHRYHPPLRRGHVQPPRFPGPQRRTTRSRPHRLLLRASPRRPLHRRQPRPNAPSKSKPTPTRGSMNWSCAASGPACPVLTPSKPSNSSPAKSCRGLG